MKKILLYALLLVLLTNACQNNSMSDDDMVTPPILIPQIAIDSVQYECNGINNDSLYFIAKMDGAENCLQETEDYILQTYTIEHRSFNINSDSISRRMVMSVRKLFSGTLYEEYINLYSPELDRASLLNDYLPFLTEGDLAFRSNNTNIDGFSLEMGFPYFRSEDSPFGGPVSYVWTYSTDLGNQNGSKLTLTEKVITPTGTNSFRMYLTFEVNCTLYSPNSDHIPIEVTDGMLKMIIDYDE